MPAKKNKKYLRLSRSLEITIVVVAVTLVLFVVSLAIKVTHGVTRTVDSPDHSVRLQVLNGCGQKGLAGRMADQLDNYRDKEMLIRVVDSDNFDLAEVERSFVISRDADKSSAKLFAEKVGLDPAEVVYRQLENNIRQVSVTLVLGTDYEKVGFVESQKQE